MANYYGSCRTNFFRVKDDKAFEAAMDGIDDVEYHNRDGKYVLLGNNADGAGWPTYKYDEARDDHEDLDLVDEVFPYLADGEVAIFMEVGAEKLRFLIGYAEAVNNKGERDIISLTDIYERAAKLTDRPEDITQCEY